MGASPRIPALKPTACQIVHRHASARVLVLRGDFALTVDLELQQPQLGSVHSTSEVVCQKGFARRRLCFAHSQNPQEGIWAPLAEMSLPPRAVALPASSRSKSPPSVRRALAVVFGDRATFREELQMPSLVSPKGEASWPVASSAHKSGLLLGEVDRVLQPPLSWGGRASCVFPHPTQAAQTGAKSETVLRSLLTGLASRLCEEGEAGLYDALADASHVQTRLLQVPHSVQGVEVHIHADRVKRTSEEAVEGRGPSTHTFLDRH